MSWLLAYALVACVLLMREALADNDAQVLRSMKAQLRAATWLPNLLVLIWRQLRAVHAEREQEDDDGTDAQR